MFDAAQISVRAEALLHATNRFLLSSNLDELARAVVDATDSMFAPSDSAVVFRTRTARPRCSPRLRVSTGRAAR